MPSLPGSGALIGRWQTRSTISLEVARAAGRSAPAAWRWASPRTAALQSQPAVRASPWAMIAASSPRRCRADMVATRDVLDRVGPLRPCMGMSFRSRCQRAGRAGGIPLHLQQGGAGRSVNFRVDCATAGGLRQGFAEKNRSCSPSGVNKVSQSRGPESENQSTVSGQPSEESGD